jgi:hypothetical protein
MDRKPTYRERLAYGAITLVGLYITAWLKLSGTADRADDWLA